MGTVCTIRIDFLSGQQLKNPRHQTLGLVNIYVLLLYHKKTVTWHVKPIPISILLKFRIHLILMCSKGNYSRSEARRLQIYKTLMEFWSPNQFQSDLHGDSFILQPGLYACTTSNVIGYLNKVYYGVLLNDIISYIQS